MKILITLLQQSAGGAFLYTEELYKELIKNHKVFYINGKKLKTNSLLELKSLELLKNIKFDLIIIMQSDHYKKLNINFESNKIINIIHSEVYDVDQPLILNNIKYIAVRVEISKYIINNFNINQN